MFHKAGEEGAGVDDLRSPSACPSWPCAAFSRWAICCPASARPIASKQVDATTIRHLTMASKSQQKAWLALFDDAVRLLPDRPSVQAMAVRRAIDPGIPCLFDTADMKGIVSDLFGEDSYFADGEAFCAQNAAIEARRAAYLEAGWGDVVIVPPGEHFHSWEYEKAPKRKGGRVYIEVRGNGEVIFHEGYVTGKEARRIERGEAVEPAIKTRGPSQRADAMLHRPASPCRCARR
jgi:ParB family chromosome partitioning protein